MLTYQWTAVGAFFYKDKSSSSFVGFLPSITCRFSKQNPFKDSLRLFDAVFLSPVMEHSMIHLLRHFDAFKSPSQTVIFVDVPITSLIVHKTVKIVKFGS